MNARQEDRETTRTTDAEQDSAGVRLPRQDRRATVGVNQGKVKDPIADEQAARDWESHTPALSDGHGPVRGYQRQGGTWAPSSSHRGRPSSWAAVSLATVGFVLCGLALILDWTMVLLITGGVLLVAALAVALFYDILTDVVLDSPRDEPEEPHGTPLHRLKARARERRNKRS